MALENDVLAISRETFKRHLLGRPERTSEFGVIYGTWRNGRICAEGESHGPRLTFEEAELAARDFFKERARAGYDTVVWRSLPEVSGHRILSFRLHFMRWKDVD